MWAMAKGYLRITKFIAYFFPLWLNIPELLVTFFYGTTRHAFQLPFSELADVFGAKIVTVLFINRHHFIL